MDQIIRFTRLGSVLIFPFRDFVRIRSFILTMEMFLFLQTWDFKKSQKKEAHRITVERGFFMSDEALRMANDKGIWLRGSNFFKRGTGGLRKSADLSRIVDRLKKATKIGAKMALDRILSWKFTAIHVEAGSHLLDTCFEPEVPAKDLIQALPINDADGLEMENIRSRIKHQMRTGIIAT